MLVARPSLPRPLVHCTRQQNRHPEAIKDPTPSSHPPNTTLSAYLCGIHVRDHHPLSSFSTYLHAPFNTSTIPPSLPLHMPPYEQTAWSDAKFYLGLGLAYFFSFIIFFKLLYALGGPICVILFALGLIVPWWIETFMCVFDANDLPDGA